MRNSWLYRTTVWSISWITTRGCYRVAFGEKTNREKDCSLSAGPWSEPRRFMLITTSLEVCDYVFRQVCLACRGAELLKAGGCEAMSAPKCGISEFLGTGWSCQSWPPPILLGWGVQLGFHAVTRDEMNFQCILQDTFSTFRTNLL